jgi:tetrahydromethanopterin S-methyltransferase subunit E
MLYTSHLYGVVGFLSERWGGIYRQLKVSDQRGFVEHVDNCVSKEIIIIVQKQIFNFNLLV